MPDVRSRLIPVKVPKAASAAVLVLHGGADRTQSAEGVLVRPTQLSVLRMIPVADRVARAGQGQLAVYRVLNSVRGWNQASTPVDDARWAMAEVRRELGDETVFGLVGHSLGGRAALLAAGESGVRSVVALAPWVYPSDRPTRTEGRRFLFVHGTRDRIASPKRSVAVAQALAPHAAYIGVEGGTHAMLRHHAQFDGYAAAFTAGVLTGRAAEGPVARALAGEQWQDV